MRFGLRVWVSMGLAAWCAAVAGQELQPQPQSESQRCVRAGLPTNVHLTPSLARALMRVYERSSTFRAQCDRVAAAPHVRVTVVVKPHMPSYCRAYTVITRRGNAVDAAMYLPPSSDYSELVGHEFEHLVEQIEGLNLRRLSKVRGSGVDEIERDLFESNRAQAAGRLVAAEVRQHRAPAAD